MSVRDLEHASRDIELAAWRCLDSTAAKIDDSIAASNADGEVGIPDRRQRCNRTQGCSAGLNIDGEPVVGDRRTVVLELLHPRVAGDHNALDHAPVYMFFDPRSDIDRRKY